MESPEVRKNLPHDTVPLSSEPRTYDSLSDTPKIVVCVDESASSSKIIPYAQAVASALGAEVTLIHVIEPQESVSPRFDPVEWDIRRRKACLYVSQLAGEHATEGKTVANKVLEGRLDEQICGWVSGRPEDITALCRRDGDAKWHIGGTLHRVLESGSGSILLVPDNIAPAKVVKFARVFVPLDGSPRAESSVLVAMKIARAQGAEIVLIHATPEPVLTQAGPLEPEDIALKERIQRRNERVAREYLDRICAWISAKGLAVRKLILKGGDVRRLLSDAIAGDTEGLLVMTSHGVSGHGDVPSGDIASFMLARSAVPVLMIKRPREKANNHLFSIAESKGVRRPTVSIG